MPLQKIERIAKNKAWGLWRITESENDLAQEVNFKGEGKPFNNATHPLKKMEWLAGRILLRQLAEYMGIAYSGIFKDEWGKPHLRDFSYHISLTHSYPFLAAIVDLEAPVGIDIEMPQDKLRRIAHKFLSSTELADADQDLVKLCIYWCAKETLYKIHGKKRLAFKTHLKIEPFEMLQEGLLQGNIEMENLSESHKMLYKQEKEFIIVHNY